MGQKIRDKTYVEFDTEDQFSIFVVIFISVQDDIALLVCMICILLFTIIIVLTKVSIIKINYVMNRYSSYLLGSCYDYSASNKENSIDYLVFCIEIWLTKLFYTMHWKGESRKELSLITYYFNHHILCVFFIHCQAQTQLQIQLSWVD